jgi:hypothetical protein
VVFTVPRTARADHHQQPERYDGVIKQTIGSNAAWFRYNFDGYGETSAGGPYNNFLFRAKTYRPRSL